MIGGDHERRNAEDLRGGERVNVVAAAVGFDQQRVVREVREQAQFDLRIVGGEQNVAGFGDEGGANAAPEFGADGNVLQIRIRGRETSGGGSGLAEGGVHAPGCGIDQRGQCIDVSRFQFRELTVVENHAGDRMIFGQSFQYIDSGRYGAALAVFHRLGQIHAVEENVAQLLGRADVEFHPGGFVNLFFALRGDLALQFRRHLRQRGGVDFDSGLLHARQHGNERQIDFFVELGQALALDFVAQCGGQRGP